MKYQKQECGFEVCKTEEQWKKELGERYEILRGKGTEMPFTGSLVKNKEKGMYVCGACENELFSSDDKFDSGTRWSSFFNSVSKDNILLQMDDSLGITRVEVLCKRCGSHLGHFFRDGPKKARYCINSGALDFKKE